MAGSPDVFHRPWYLDMDRRLGKVSLTKFQRFEP